MEGGNGEWREAIKGGGKQYKLEGGNEKEVVGGDERDNGGRQ